MKKFLLLIVAGSLFLPSWGQSRNVKGIIVSENGFPMKNVKLSVADVNYSTKTNKNGMFVLKKVNSEDTIVVHIDKNTYVKFNLGSYDSLKIVLSDNMVSIHNRENIPLITPVYTGSINKFETRPVSVITAKMIEQRKPSDLVELIKTLVPGVKAFNTGFPSGDVSVSIRGNNTFASGGGPLVFIDGVESTFSDANRIPVELIDYIEIVKDGVGYGVKGANGAIVIKTKR